MTVLEKITEIFHNQMGDDDMVITADTTLEQAGLDSLDMVEIIMELEDAFSVSIADDMKFETVGALAQYIEEHKE